MLRCDGLVRERGVLMKRMAKLTTGFEERGDEEVALVLNEGCRDLKAGKAIRACGGRDSILQNSWPGSGLLVFPLHLLLYDMSILICFNTILSCSVLHGAVALVCMHMRHLIIMEFN